MAGFWTIICFFGWCAVTGPAIVTDGDTLRVAGYAVRLQGVDAEEMDEPNGPEAKAIMQQIVGHDPVTCSMTGERSYNRVVAVCFVRDIEINAEIIRRGAALDCAHYSHGRYRHLEPAGARERLRQKPYC